MQGDAFYVRVRDKVYGPFIRQQLALRVEGGKITADDSISSDRQTWVAVKDVDWLSPKLALVSQGVAKRSSAPAGEHNGSSAKLPARVLPAAGSPVVHAADPRPGLPEGAITITASAPLHSTAEGPGVVRPVFVSHSTEDAAAANEIVAALESAGINCWIAPRNIPHGSNWEKSLTGALEGCRTLLLVYSKTAVSSHFVACEVDEAVQRNIPILPVKLEEAEAPFGIKSRLRQFQWINAESPPIGRHLPTIIAGVQALLGLARTPARAEGAGAKRYIGNYLLGAPLAEGKMGTVYKAEQIKGVKRVVALKLIRAGADTEDVVARFATEQEVLARMNHPNIAQFLDVGVEDGRSYFAMEFVPGVAINKFADSQRLTLRARLELFLQVCDAIAHAHAKSIIHRDIRSGNVLCYLSDDKLTAKVIDFGIAKAFTDERLVDRNLSTEDGKFAGKYGTMSPEQAEGSADLDTRSDVYSLGVLLYQLLAGFAPFDPEVLSSSTDMEARRIIREEEPPLPSRKLATMGEEADRIARSRQLRPDSLRRQLKRELEWIPQMAIRKERQRRYASPLLLAEDIQNYLHSRPLMAGPKSRIYRFRKYVRRNKVVLTAIVVSLFLVGMGTAHHVIAIQAAEQQAKRQTQIATAVNQFMSEMLSDADPKKGHDLTIVSAIDTFIRKLNADGVSDPLVAASIWDTIGDVQRSLGSYDASESSFDTAERICTTKPGSADRDIGKYLARIWDHRGHLLKDEIASRIDDMKGTPRSEFAGPKRDWWKAIDAHAAGELKTLSDKARDNYDRSLKLFRDMPAYEGRELDVAATLADRASLLQTYKVDDDAENLKNLEAAEKDCREGLDLRRTHDAPAQDVLQSMGALVDILIQKDPHNLIDAREMMNDALSRAHALPADDPNRARLLLSRSRLLKAAGDAKGAIEASRDAVLIDNNSLGPAHRYTVNALKQLNRCRADEKLPPTTVDAVVAAGRK